MDKVRITNTDLMVTQIGLGSSHFGTHTDKQTAIAVLDKWYAAGGNLYEICKECSRGKQQICKGTVY